MNLVHRIRYILEQDRKVQWLIYLVLAVILILLSIWQQQYGISSLQNQLIEEVRILKASNEKQTNLLRSNLQESKAIRQLTNDEIASLFESLSAKDQAKVASLDFYREKNNKDIDLVRIKAELIVSMEGLFTLIDKKLGKSLFIASFTIRSYDEARVRMLVELLQDVQ